MKICVHKVFQAKTKGETFVKLMTIPYQMTTAVPPCINNYSLQKYKRMDASNPDNMTITSHKLLYFY